MTAALELVAQVPFGIDAAALDRLAPLREAFPSRAATRQAQTPAGYWFGRFGMAHRDEWPAAAWRQSANADDGHWLCADPVGFVIEGADVVVNAHAGADLAADEAATWVGMLNRHFEPEGLRFVTLRPSRWLVRLPFEPTVRTTPASLAHRHALMAVAPRGADATRLTRIANETQMLFHDCASNQDRQSRGRLPLGGVWLWGAGRRGEAMPMSADLTLCSDEPHLRSLADAAGATVHDRPADAKALACGSGTTLVDLCDTALEGEEWLAWFERDWLAPLAGSASGTKVGLTLLFPDLAVGAPLFRRAWRLPFGRRGLAAWLASPTP